MKSIIMNEHHLQENEIQEIVTRVKLFVINEKKEVLLASSNGGVQLVGGHMEEGEDAITTIQREIKEETGMEITSKDISEPFFEIHHYVPNYFNTGKKVLSKIVYYWVQTNQEINTANTHLTEQEEQYAFHVQRIPIQQLEQYLSTFLKNEQTINQIIAQETIYALQELQQVTNGFQRWEK